MNYDPLLDLEKQAEFPLMGDDWSQVVQNKLNEIRESSLDKEQIHIIARDYYNLWKYRIHVPFIIFNCITAAFASFQEADGNNFQIVKICIIISSTVATILSALIVFFDFDGLAKSHNGSANEYNELANYIYQFLYLPVDKRPDSMVLFENARNKISSIASKSEYLHSSFVEQYYKDHQDRIKLRFKNSQYDPNSIIVSIPDDVLSEPISDPKPISDKAVEKNNSNSSELIELVDINLNE